MFNSHTLCGYRRDLTSERIHVPHSTCLPWILTCRQTLVGLGTGVGIGPVIRMSKGFISMGYNICDYNVEGGKMSGWYIICLGDDHVPGYIIVYSRGNIT